MLSVSSEVMKALARKRVRYTAAKIRMLLAVEQGGPTMVSDVLGTSLVPCKQSTDQDSSW